MRRRRTNIELTERQQLALALLLVFMIAISLLYCVGLGSLALREAWRNAPLPANGTVSPEQYDPAPTTLPEQSPLPTPPAQ